MAKNLEDMTPAELKAQADALLAADAHKNSAAEKEVGKPAAKGGKKTSRKKSDAAPEEPMRLLTDEEAKKAGILRLDDKQVAALPAVNKFKRTAHPDTDLLQSRLPCIVRQRLSYMHREYFDDLQSHAPFPAMSNSMTCPKKYDSFLRRS